MSVFQNKVALITGGASGIGKAFGEHLSRQGAFVVLADRNTEGAAAAAAAIVAAGGQATAVTLDVTDPVAFERVVQEIAATRGHLDYLFNNAGIAIGGEVRVMTLADWNRLLDVNVRGVIHGVNAAYPVMIRQSSGHIINTASAAGLLPVPGMAIYGMTKHAVVGLSTSLRGEARRYGVNVSVVCPGFINTPLLENSPLINVDRDIAMNMLPLGNVDSLAVAVLRGVTRNRAIIPYTPFARIAWFLYRLFPQQTVNLIARNHAHNPLLAGAKKE